MSVTEIVKINATVLGMTAALLAVGVGCGDDEPSTPPPGADEEVSVQLSEWAIIPDDRSVPPGEMTFRVENAGPLDNHEMVVVRSDLAPGFLPTNQDGSFDESGEGLEILGEVEELTVGASGSMILELASGSYVLACNIVEIEPSGEVEAHYGRGMYTSFRVE